MEPICPKRLAADRTTAIAEELRLNPRRAVVANMPIENMPVAFQLKQLDLHVSDFKSKGYVSISLEESGHHDLARLIFDRLRTLPGVQFSRYVELTAPRGRFQPERFLELIASLAKRHGFHQTTRCASAYLACYESSRIELRPWTRFTETELAVELTEPGWTPLADSVEAELRRVLFEE